MNVTVPSSAKLKTGTSKNYVKCERRGYHMWKDARIVVDPVDRKKGIMPCATANRTHRVCLTCGKVLPV